MSGGPRQEGYSSCTGLNSYVLRFGGGDYVYSADARVYPDQLQERLTEAQKRTHWIGAVTAVRSKL